MRKDKSTGKSAIMQHRHMAFIANVIAGLPTHAQKSSITLAFAEALAKTNPNFDRSRFFNAAGIDDPYVTQAAYPNDEYHAEYKRLYIDENHGKESKA